MVYSKSGRINRTQEETIFNSSSPTSCQKIEVGGKVGPKSQPKYVCVHNTRALPLIFFQQIKKQKSKFLHVHSPSCLEFSETFFVDIRRQVGLSDRKSHFFSIFNKARQMGREGRKKIFSYFASFFCRRLGTPPGDAWTSTPALGGAADPGRRPVATFKEKEYIRA